MLYWEKVYDLLTCLNDFVEVITVILKYHFRLGKYLATWHDFFIGMQNWSRRSGTNLHQQQLDLLLGRTTECFSVFLQKISLGQENGLGQTSFFLSSSSSSSSSSSDGLVQYCMTLSWLFSHKTAAFYTEWCTSPSLFCNFQVVSWSILRTFWTMICLGHHFIICTRAQSGHTTNGYMYMTQLHDKLLLTFRAAPGY